MRRRDNDDTAPRQAAVVTRTNSRDTDSGIQLWEQRESFTVDVGWGRGTVTTSHMTAVKENAQGKSVVLNVAAIAVGV